MSSSPATGQEPAGVRTYTFHGTPSNIDDASGMITVKHEEIKGYSPQGEATYKVANPDILKQVTVGKETHFTIRVAGDQVLVTKVQEGHDHADEHPKQ
ncbi:MAG: copper-binding protein [Candidatus Kapaibacterium sp.]